MRRVWNRPDDGGSKHPRNVSKLLADYTALHPNRQPSLLQSSVPSLRTTLKAVLPGRHCDMCVSSATDVPAYTNHSQPVSTVDVTAFRPLRRRDCDAIKKKVDWRSCGDQAIWFSHIEAATFQSVADNMSNEEGDVILMYWYHRKRNVDQLCSHTHWTGPRHVDAPGRLIIWCRWVNRRHTHTHTHSHSQLPSSSYLNCGHKNCTRQATTFTVFPTGHVYPGSVKLARYLGQTQNNEKQKQPIHNPVPTQ
jgi:hypothetical protein